MKRNAFVLAGLSTLLFATAAIAQAPKANAGKPSYKRDLPPALVREARITEPQAAAIALTAIPGAKIDKMELEKEDGQFIYSYDLKTRGKRGIDEVHVDAMTGALLNSVHETPALEKAEAAKEKAEKKSATKRPPAAAKP